MGISVPDLEKAVEYYTKIMGFPEAYRINSARSNTPAVFVQISKDTFLELQTATREMPPGITHLALQVENLAAAKETLGQRGAAIGQTFNLPTRAILTNLADPNGNRLELLEFPPDSVPRQAIERWR